MLFIYIFQACKLNNEIVTDLVISDLIRDPLGLFGLATPQRYSLGNQLCSSILASRE